MKHEVRVCIDVPSKTGPDVFRSEAADEILRVLADAHETEFTVPELVNATSFSRSTVWRAIDLLDSISAVQVRETPQRKYVAIDATRLQKDDPILAIEQPEFHDPVRAFVSRVQDALAETKTVEALVGVVVFGSVARGEADRQSDIDVFVVVNGDRTTARRVVTDVASELGDRRFDGDRFEFEPYVETEASAERAGSKLREIFEDGITVHGSDRLQSLRKQVYADE